MMRIHRAMRGAEKLRRADENEVWTGTCQEGGWMACPPGKRRRLPLYRSTQRTPRQNNDALPYLSSLLSLAFAHAVTASESTTEPRMIEATMYSDPLVER